MGTPDAHFGGASTLTVPGQWERLTAFYEEFIDALAVRDSDLAASLVLANVTAFRDARLLLWRDRNRQR